MDMEEEEEEELLHIRPPQLNFLFELKKHSSCTVQLENRSHHYVAFKVKTTSPANYWVRPNVGIVKPRATSEFTVVMQAMKVAPPGLQCKDKFLVQSTVVPEGTTQEDITSAIFSRDSGKHVEQRKMKVILVDPSVSPAPLPRNARLDKDPHYEFQGGVESEGLENMHPPDTLARVGSSLEDAGVCGELESPNKAESSSNDSKGGQKLVNEMEQKKLVMEFEDLKSKLHVMGSKLEQADGTIAKLTDERNMINRESETLKHEVGLMRKNRARRTKRGFPFLFVCMVALISLALGYLSHS